MKIERRYMAHYLNAAFGSGEASYTRLGQDLEEYAPELTANVEKKSNILGQTSVVIDSYQKQGEVSPYYAEEGDPLFEKLQTIIDEDTGAELGCHFCHQQYQFTTEELRQLLEKATRE